MADRIKSVAASLVNLNIRKKLITGKIRLAEFEDDKGKIESLVLIHRNSLGNESHYFPVKIAKRGKYQSIFFEIETAKITWKPFYWDIYIELSIDHEQNLVRVKVPSYKMKLIMTAFPYCKPIHIKQDYYLYPYVTSYGSFSFTYKKRMFFENSSYRWKWFFAFVIYLLFIPYWMSKKIWLGFEKDASSAQDNGFTFFRYCYEHEKHKNYYYVMKEKSPDVQNLEGMEDKLLLFMSFKYMVYFFAASLLVSSESKGHIYDIRIQNGLLRRILNRKKHIFLQHGVMGLKRIDKIFHKKGNNRTDLFIASSEFEKQIIFSNFGYQENEIEVTGLSRWDHLFNTAIKNKVLIMPSWRAWMDDISDTEFKDTAYYRKYLELLTSTELKALIKKYHLSVTFYLHPKFVRYLHLFELINNDIEILSYGKSSLQKEIMNASLMITDYSSVAWDMYYLKKPVIFYQFDRDEYLNHQGSYLEFPKELFGDQTMDHKTLIQLLAGYANSDFHEKQEFSKKRNQFFKYMDHKNSERIYRAITEHFPEFV